MKTTKKNSIDKKDFFQMIHQQINRRRQEKSLPVGRLEMTIKILFEVTIIFPWLNLRKNIHNTTKIN